jgi:hypothetical protein
VLRRFVVAAVAAALGGVSQASATPVKCAHEWKIISDTVAAHNSLNCVNGAGVGNLVQSIEISGGRIVATLRGTRSDGSPVTISSSANVSELGTMGLDGVKEKCGSFSDLLLMCKSGACVSTVDSSAPATNPLRGWLFQFSVGDREAGKRHRPRTRLGQRVQSDAFSIRQMVVQPCDQGLVQHHHRPIDLCCNIHFRRQISRQI